VHGQATGVACRGPWALAAEVKTRLVKQRQVLVAHDKALVQLMFINVCSYSIIISKDIGMLKSFYCKNQIQKIDCFWLSNL